MKIVMPIIMLLFMLNACKPFAPVISATINETNTAPVELITYVNVRSRDFTGDYRIQATIDPLDGKARKNILENSCIYKDEIAGFYRNIPCESYSNNLRNMELRNILNSDASSRGNDSNIIEHIDIKIVKRGLQH